MDAAHRNRADSSSESGSQAIQTSSLSLVVTNVCLVSPRTMKPMRSLFSTPTLRHLTLSPLQTSRSAFVPSEHIQNQVSQCQSRSVWKGSRPREDKGPETTEGRQLKDEEIRSNYIRIANSEHQLEPPARLRDVLQSIERPANFILQVAPPTRDELPICRIMNRAAIREFEKTKAKAAQAAKSSNKQMELNWAINPHDLSHRLKQLTNFLDKGRRVEIVLTRKKGKRLPTVEEVKHLMNTVLETVKAAEATQVKPMEGEPGKQVTLVVKKRDT